MVDDTAPTSSGGSVAGVVIALLLIGVVIVVVVYRVRTKKTAMSTKPPPADYEEDAVLKNARKKVPVKEDKEEMVMIDNIVYEGGKPVPKTAQVAENDYEDIKCLQQPTVTSASAGSVNHDRTSKDDEVVMIDNILYEGGNAATRGFPLAGHDYEELSKAKKYGIRDRIYGWTRAMCKQISYYKFTS
nr:hypothetical protein BaRGS_035256 [Batillaria attramentaria]